MLRLDAVTGGYGSTNVLDRISIEVAAKESVALLGPNGAGKSTLLGAITGTIPRRGGRIEFDGQDVGATPSHRIFAKGLVLVPEGRQIFAPLTVLDNLRLGAIRVPQKRHRERLDEIYALFPRLKERREQIASTLSGGEQQMLAIGRALMSRPRLLLLDEPFLGLAPLIVEEIWNALHALKEQGLTILLVEQNAAIALGCSTYAYILENGEMALEGASAKLRQDDSVRRTYLGG